MTYLFTSDVLGENARPPRHAHAYANLRRMREEMQSERVRAFTEFVADVRGGAFPTARQSVLMDERELDVFRHWLGS